MSNDADPPGRAGVRRIVTANSTLSVEYDRCSVCEQTSLRGPAAIEHAPDCPHVSGAIAESESESGDPQRGGEAE